MNREKALELKNMLLVKINEEQKEQIKCLKQANFILSILSAGLILTFFILRSS